MIVEPLGAMSFVSVNQRQSIDALQIVLREELNRELPLLEKRIRKYSHYRFADQTIPDTVHRCPLNCLLCRKCAWVSSLLCKVCGGQTCIFCEACLHPSTQKCRQRNRDLLALKLYGGPILQFQGLANCLGVRINPRVLEMSRTLSADQNVILRGYACPHIRCQGCKRIYEPQFLNACRQCESRICVACEKLIHYPGSQLGIMSLIVDYRLCLPCYCEQSRLG